MTPTQRTLKAMREQGRICGMVERFNAHVGPFGIRQDLFGFIDLIAIDPTQGIIAIQSCGQDWAGHVRKIKEERNEAAFEWLKHAKAELWAWRKVKLTRGGKAERWKPRIGDLILTHDGDIAIVERK
jgi:hypothetical protein